MAKKKTKKKSTTRPRRRTMRRRTTRRSNPGTPTRRSMPWKELMIAGLAGIAALYAGGYIADTETFKDFTEGDEGTSALTQAGIGIAGGAATYYATKSLPAALGVVAGLAGAAGYAYLNKDKDDSKTEVTVTAEGTTAGLGYPRRRRLGQAYDDAGRPINQAGTGGACCASCASGGPCKSACPTPDDMAAIYEEDACDVPEDVDPADLC